MSWFTDKKLLVPIDFGKASAGAIKTALKLASTPHDVHVVHIDQDLAVTSPAAMWDAKPIDERRKNVEAYYQKSLGSDRFREVSFHVEFGDPGNEIAEFAKQIGADAIVIPSHGRTGMRRLLLGSVTEKVVRLAHCPVLVLKEYRGTCWQDRKENKNDSSHTCRSW